MHFWGSGRHVIAPDFGRRLPISGPSPDPPDQGLVSPDFLKKKKIYIFIYIFSSPDEVQESLCCHPVVGVGVGFGDGVGIGVSTYNLIDYNSHTHLLTPFIFGTHMT